MTSSPLKKKSLLSYVGYRVTLELDDASRLTGRLLSFSSTGNAILSDVERERPLKRRRGDTGAPRFRREVYGSVVFIRGDSIISVRYTKSVITDEGVVDRVGGKASNTSRKIDITNLTPSLPK